MTRQAIVNARLALSLSPAQWNALRWVTCGSETTRSSTSAKLASLGLVLGTIGESRPLGYGANGGHLGWTERVCRRTQLGAEIARVLCLRPAMDYSARARREGIFAEMA